MENTSLYKEIINLFESNGFRCNYYSLQGAFLKLYCTNPEIQKAADKLFARLYPSEYSDALVSEMIVFCCLKEGNDINDKEKLSKAIQLTLALILVLKSNIKDDAKISQLLKLFYKKDKIILWKKSKEEGYDILSLPIDGYSVSSADFPVVFFKTTKIFSNKVKNKVCFYTKKNNGKLLGFNDPNEDVELTYKELNNKLLSVRRNTTPLKITQENCNWCAPKGNHREKGRCQRCEGVYKQLCSLNAKGGENKRYKSNREISQNIKRLRDGKKSSKPLVDAILIVCKRIYKHNENLGIKTLLHQSYSAFSAKIRQAYEVS